MACAVGLAASDALGWFAPVLYALHVALALPLLISWLLPRAPTVPAVPVYLAIAVSSAAAHACNSWALMSTPEGESVFAHAESFLLAPWALESASRGSLFPLLATTGLSLVAAVWAPMAGPMLVALWPIGLAPLARAFAAQGFAHFCQAGISWDVVGTAAASLLYARTHLQAQARELLLAAVCMPLLGVGAVSALALALRESQRAVKGE